MWEVLCKPWRWLHQRSIHIRSTVMHAIDSPHDWHYGKQEMEEICVDLSSPPFMLDNKQQHFAGTLRCVASDARKGTLQQLRALGEVIGNVIAELKLLKKQAECEDSKISFTRWKTCVDLAFVGGARPAHSWTRASPSWNEPTVGSSATPLDDGQILQQESVRLIGLWCCQPM